MSLIDKMQYLNFLFLYAVLYNLQVFIGQCSICVSILWTFSAIEVNSLLFFSVFVGDCPSGQYESQGVCVNCAVGTYRDKSEGFDCKQCSTGYTTAGTGATSSANCSISKSMYKSIMIGHSINYRSLFSVLLCTCI